MWNFTNAQAFIHYLVYRRPREPSGSSTGFTRSVFLRRGDYSARHPHPPRRSFAPARDPANAAIMEGIGINPQVLLNVAANFGDIPAAHADFANPDTNLIPTRNAVVIRQGTSLNMYADECTEFGDRGDTSCRDARPRHGRAICSRRPGLVAHPASGADWLGHRGSGRRNLAEGFVTRRRDPPRRCLSTIILRSEAFEGRL